MARVGGVRTLAALGCAAALVCMAACGDGGDVDNDTPKAAAREQKPLPEEPRVETIDVDRHLRRALRHRRDDRPEDVQRA